ncbi:MAG: hypothetical protein M1371_10780 [Actinobacteria bacterium]|nr:hypothetical protein [Actinomycetota bacterium]
MEITKPLTGLIVSDDEEFLIICPELSLIAKGENMLDAKESLYKLLFDFYFALSFNRARLNKELNKSYEIFQKKVFPWSGQRRGILGNLFSSGDSGGGLMGLIRRQDEKAEFNWEEVIDFRIL